MANNTISQVEINNVTYDLLDANTLSALNNLKTQVTTLNNDITTLKNKTTPTMKTPGSSTSGQNFRISSGVTEDTTPDIRLYSLGNIRLMYAIQFSFTSAVTQNNTRSIVVLPESDCPPKIVYAHAILTGAFIGGPYILIPTSSSKIITFQNKTTNATAYPKESPISFTAI